MKKPPFIQLATECDISFTGVRFAKQQFAERTGEPAEILWIHKDDLILAREICREHTELLIAIDSGYEEHTWSVGTLLDKGVGSVGA